MKTTLIKQTILAISLAIAAFSPRHIHAQTAEEALKQTFTAYDTAQTYSQKVPLVAQFKLIASKWADNWLTNYYAAFSIAVLSFEETDKAKREPMLNEADVYFEKIKSKATDNEEVNILGALLASARIAAKPSAYKKYGDIRDKYLAATEALNPNNPRIYYLRGNATYYTPKMFGGGPKNALPLYEKAAGLFATESKAAITKPYWGTRHNLYMLSLCKLEIK